MRALSVEAARAHRLELSMNGLTIPVEFNGHVFVPLVRVEVPEGTRCVVQLPILKPPAPVNEEHRQLWEEVTRQVEGSTPPYATLDEAMEALRGRQ